MEREDWDNKYEGDELLWHAEPNRFLVEATADLDPGVVLDVACGEGRNAVWLAQGGWRATGVDFSSVALGKARRLAATRGVDVEWVEADVRTWRPAPPFDLVALLYLHLPASQRRSVLRAFADAVSPGGHFLVIGHDLDNLTKGIGGPQDPDVLFTAADVAGDIEGSGLVVERAEQVRRPVATDDEEGDALDVLFRGVRPRTRTNGGDLPPRTGGEGDGRRP
jgi:SAM-dependent methyltransferase